MSTASSKTLNQAFLRAYAKDARHGAHSGTIPAPHAFDRPQRQRSMQPENLQHKVAAEPAASSHLEAPISHAAEEQPIPAPHVAFPAVYAVSTESFNVAPSLLVSQIDTSALVEDSPQPITKPVAPPSTRPAADGPHFTAHAAHSSPSTSPAPAREVVSENASPAVVDKPASQFAAAWEVDRFGWTDECQQLFQNLATAFDDAGEQLRTVTEEGLHVLAVSSTYRGEGRTTVATLLARAAAQAGVSVALLDADVENPQLATQLKVRLSGDWLNAMDGTIPLEEVAVASVEENILAYPLRAEAREQVILLNHSEFVRLLRRVSETVDLVIVDLGPYTGDERRMFPSGSACPIDAAIVVRDVRSTSEQQSLTVAESLRLMGVEAVGIAENFVRD